MRTSFRFDLDHQILPGLCALGRFDGKNPSLALATNGGKVLLHSLSIPRRLRKAAGATMASGI